MFICTASSDHRQLLTKEHKKSIHESAPSFTLRLYAEEVMGHPKGWQEFGIYRGLRAENPAKKYRKRMAANRIQYKQWVQASEHPEKYVQQNK